MTQDEFKKLQRGDIVVNSGSGNSYVVVDIIAAGVPILVRTIIGTNHTEWELFSKSKLVDVEIEQPIQADDV